MAERGLRLGALFAVLVLGPAAAPAAAPDIEPSRAVGGTHDCAAYYPDISRMLSESGDVQVGYDVAADGAISNVKVVRSSGFERLDRAAVQCVSRNWRNTPARRNGVPVASPDHQAIIRFTLSGSEDSSASGALDASGLQSQPGVLSLPDAIANPPAARGGTRALTAGEALAWCIGILAVLAWIVVGLRRWIFRARICPTCNARNRGLLPFVPPGYCSTCGTRFARE